MYFSTSTRIFPTDIINQIVWQFFNNNQLKAGDVVKVKIKEKANGILNRLELSDNKVVNLNNGDEFVGVIGSRSAIDYLSGQPPVGDLTFAKIYTLSIGGIIGEVTDFTENVSHPPSVEIIAYATLDSKLLNTIEYYLNSVKFKNFTSRRDTKAIIVVGDGRSSGKTTTVAKCIATLKDKNIKLGAAKLTGIARKRDVLEFSKNGCNMVTDFIDCGLPSSVIEKEIYEKSISYLIDEKFIGEYLWICELGGGFLSEYNVETAIDLLNKKLNIVAYIICSKTRTATYGCYIILNGILDKLGKNNTEIFVSGAITNSNSGILSIKKYSSSISILKVFDTNDNFYSKIQIAVK